MSALRRTPRRAPRGSGWVRHNGTHWVVMRSGTVNGKRRRWTEGPYPTKAEATAASRRPSTVSATGATKLIDWLDIWYADRSVILLATGKSSTLEQYDKHIRRVKPHIDPNLRIGEVRRRHIEHLLVELLTQGLTRKYVTNIRSTLSVAFESAIDNETGLTTNPARGVKLPSDTKPAPPVQILTDDDWRTFQEFLSARATSDGGYALAALTVLLTGVRLGEAMGLKWSDIDWKHRTVTINRQVIRQRKPVNRLVVTSLKTSESNRTLSIPESLYHVLRHHRNRTNVIVHDGFIVQGRDGGPGRPEGLHRWLADIAYPQSGVPDVAVHGLRHTLASLLLLDGESDVAVAAQLGHTDATTTKRIYAHVHPKHSPKVAARIDRLVVKPRPADEDSAADG